MQTSLTPLQQLPATTYKILNDDEKYFLQTETEHTIRQYETLKIKDTNSGHEGAALARYKIGMALSEVWEIIGLKKENHPSVELAKKIARYIQDTFPFITPGELVTAVIFGIQGKYVNTNSEGKSIFEHYGVMDIPYINTFMQLYVRFRYEKKVLIEQKIENAVIPTKEIIVDLMLKDDAAVKSMIIDAFNRFKADPEDKVNWLRDYWFDWLCDIGMIEYDKENLNERFREMKKKSIAFDKLTNTDCIHMVCLEKIYELFETLKEDENPFEIFNTVTYLNPETYRKLGHVKQA